LLYNKTIAEVQLLCCQCCCIFENWTFTWTLLLANSYFTGQPASV